MLMIRLTIMTWNMVLGQPSISCLFQTQWWDPIVHGSYVSTQFKIEYQVKPLKKHKGLKKYFNFTETITEILCHNPGEKCGGSNYYNCKQMKAKMLVGTTDLEWRVRTLRNITINIGCSCVYREPVILQQFMPGPEEKRRKRSAPVTPATTRHS